MAESQFFTRESLELMREELAELKTTGRKKISAAIAEAREKGDLKENAEYDAAKDAQGLLELKISKMEELVASARLIDESKLDISKVSVLCKVRIKNISNKAEMSYILVAENEADLKSGKISVSSPIGKGLLGKRVGEVADIQTPGGIIKFEVLDIALYH